MTRFTTRACLAIALAALATGCPRKKAADEVEAGTTTATTDTTAPTDTNASPPPTTSDSSGATHVPLVHTDGGPAVDAAAAPSDAAVAVTDAQAAAAQDASFAMPPECTQWNAKMRACLAKADAGPNAALIQQMLNANDQLWKSMSGDPTALAAACRQALAMPNPLCP